MGTPDFAVPTLEKLIHSQNHQVVAIFTQKPKPKNRGLAEIASPVHDVGVKHGIEVYSPTTLRSEESYDLISSIDADIIVVVAYGFIIPSNILALKKYGCLNIHPSLLPKYRGAAPLQRTIINGEHQTAVCIMQMDEGLDTGDIIIQQKFPLSPRITLMQLHDKCSMIGADLLIQALDEINSLPRISQDQEAVSYAHKLSKEEGRINWNDSAHSIDCKIRGMNPWPGTYFEYQGNFIKILESEYNDTDHNFIAGTVINNNLSIACGKGVLIIKKLQQSGKKAMSTEEFLLGFGIPKNVRFE